MSVDLERNRIGLSLKADPFGDGGKSVRKSGAKSKPKPDPKPDPKPGDVAPNGIRFS